MKSGFISILMVGLLNVGLDMTMPFVILHAR